MCANGQKPVRRANGRRRTFVYTKRFSGNRVGLDGVSVLWTLPESRRGKRKKQKRNRETAAANGSNTGHRVRDAVVSSGRVRITRSAFSTDDVISIIIDERVRPFIGRERFATKWTSNQTRDPLRVFFFVTGQTKNDTAVHR